VLPQCTSTDITQGINDRMREKGDPYRTRIMREAHSRDSYIPEHPEYKALSERLFRAKFRKEN
jgi:hypothetical protein